MIRFDPNKSVDDYYKEYSVESKFNKYELDDEFVNQPELYLKWCRVYVGAMIARERAKDILDRLKSKKYLEVKKNPTSYDLPETATDTAVKNVAASDEEVVTATDYYFTILEHEKNLERAVKAFEHRKELLKGEAELWINKYYSDVTLMRRDTQKEQSKEESTTTFRSSMKKRKKLNV